MRRGYPCASLADMDSDKSSTGKTGRSSRRQPVYYGWFIVATVFFIALVTVGSRNSFGAFIEPMEEALSLENRATMTWAASLGFLVNGLSQPFFGRLYDRLGIRVIISCLVIVGVFTVLLFLTFHVLFLIFVFGLVMSIAMSGSSLSNTGALLSRWFRQKRGAALAISTAGASVGGLLLVPFTLYLIEATNWRTAWIVLGGLILLFAVPLAAIILKRDPSDMGLLPDGAVEPPGGAGGKGGTTPTGPLEVDNWLSAFRTLPIWQVSMAYVVCGATTAVMSVHFIPYITEERGFSAGAAGMAFGLMSGLNAVGVIVMGTMSDKFGRKDLLGLVYTGRALAYLVLLLSAGAWGLLPAGAWGVWVFAVVAGFSWIATAPLSTSLTADFYGLKALGTLAGVSFVFHQIGAFASIQFAGYMKDFTDSYHWPFAIVGVLLIPAALAAFSVRERKYSVKYQQVPQASPSTGM